MALVLTLRMGEAVMIGDVLVQFKYVAERTDRVRVAICAPIEKKVERVGKTEDINIKYEELKSGKGIE